MRSSVPACMVSNSWPVKPLFDALRTWTSSRLPSAGALAIEKLRRRPPERMKSRYCPARNVKCSTAGSRRKTASTSSASRSMRSMRHGRLVHLDVRGRPDLARLDDQVRHGDSPGTAAHNLIGLLRGRDACRQFIVWDRRSAGQDARTTRRAVPTLAAVRQVQSGAQRRREHRLLRIGGETLPRRDDGDLWHGAREDENGPVAAGRILCSMLPR